MVSALAKVLAAHDRVLLVAWDPCSVHSVNNISDSGLKLRSRQFKKSTWPTKSALYSGSKLMRFWEFSESVKAGMRRRQASFVRRVSGISPPNRSRRQRGLHRLLTHRALGSDENHRVHAHIDAAFQFWNGLSWTRVAGDASLPHYCQCCASDNEAQEAGVEILQSLADDASCKDFMASRWQKR